MKFPKVKVIIGALITAGMACLIGSISGTLAWYQYSTRATATYIGTSAKCSELLKIRIFDAALDTDGDTDGVQPYQSNWESDLYNEDVQRYFSAKGNMGSTFSPVTPGSVAKDEALPSSFYANPIYQHFSYPSWRKASITDYVVLPLQAKLTDVDGKSTESYLQSDIFLADLTLNDNSANEGNGKGDLTSALRVHFSSTSNQLWSLNGDTLTTGDYLDLNGDGKYDRSVGYRDFQQTVVTKYGDNEGKMTSYKASGNKDTEETPMAIDDAADLVADNAIALGRTGNDGILDIKVTIWLEGWSTLSADASVIDTLTREKLDALTDRAIGDTYKVEEEDKTYRFDGENWVEVVDGSIWDATSYIGSKFDVGMRFVVDAI